MTRIRERIVLVGPGRAGCSLARVLTRAGHELIATVGGSPENRGAVAAALGQVPAVTHAEALAAGTLVIVAVPDDRLESVSLDIARGTPQSSLTLVMHVCGAKGRHVLHPIASRGAKTAAWHPLRSLPVRDLGPAGLEGALVAIECEAEDLRRLESLARAVRGRPASLDGGRRDTYHAGAATAGNAILAVFDVGLRALVHSGIPEALAREALANLAIGAITNASKIGPAAALTGPVVRGDRETVARHLAALRQDLGLADAELYAKLSAALVRIAALRPDADKAASVVDLLKKVDPT